MQHDPEFPLESIPLRQWLSTKDTADIHGKLKLKIPRCAWTNVLRLHIRPELRESS
jgi:hypothetical protein